MVSYCTVLKLCVENQSYTATAHYAKVIPVYDSIRNIQYCTIIVIPIWDLRILACLGVA